MRRSYFAILLGFMAASAQAGEMYYRTPGDPNSGNIYAVNENGGTPRVCIVTPRTPSGPPSA